MGNFAEFSCSGRIVAAYGLGDSAHRLCLAAMLTGTDPDKLTLANVKDVTIKYKNLRKNKLQLLCGTLLDHIEDLELELRLEKAKVEKAKVEHRAERKELKKTVGDLELELRLEEVKAPHNVSTFTQKQTFELRAELKELKETV
jgi:hypothetical protein